MNAPNHPLIELRNLRTWFPIRRLLFSGSRGHVKAVDDVSLQVFPGETVGLVGESGCGKTTLGRTILGLEKAIGGEVLHEGDNLLSLPESEKRKRRRHLQMIFQDPFSSLNPRMTVLEIVTEGLLEHYPQDVKKEGREELAKRLLKEVGLDPNAIHRYPHEFSGGQRQRISIARAISLKPEFIVCDEAVSALDVSVQAQVINLLRNLSRKYNLSYLFISHDLSVVKHISDRVAVMYLGKIVEVGKTNDVIGNPQHPYTQALISAIPIPGRKKKDRVILTGDVPSPANPPSGCPFHTRCPKVMDICKTIFPESRTIENRQVSCHLYTAKSED